MLLSSSGILGKAPESLPPPRTPSSNSLLDLLATEGIPEAKSLRLEPQGLCDDHCPDLQGDGFELVSWGS